MLPHSIVAAWGAARSTNLLLWVLSHSRLVCMTVWQQRTTRPVVVIMICVHSYSCYSSILQRGSRLLPWQPLLTLSAAASSFQLRYVLRTEHLEA